MERRVTIIKVKRYTAIVIAANRSTYLFGVRIMNKTDTITLTKLETEILQHRLEVPDAISEALDTPLSLVETACEILIAKGEMALYWLNCDTMKSVAVDAVEGSTWLAAMVWDESPQKIASHEKAYLSLLEKVQTASNRLIDCASY